jgi:ubiquinone/menaquinone biosynthesis C-methylase UbiE
MTTQRDIFLGSEGDEWFTRNRVALETKHSETDEVLAAIFEIRHQPSRVLEIGCADGWRLDQIRAKFGAQCNGIDPSEAAIKEGSKKYSELKLEVGTADDLPFENNQFDTIIYGFCLYLCDRSDLFKVAAEGDRVLADGGFIVVLDFHVEAPYRNAYKHYEGLYSYKMDYSKLFSWSPAYRQIYQKVFPHNSEGSLDDLDALIAVTVLRKSASLSFPER